MSQYRPRLTEEEYRVVRAMKKGWRPDLSEMYEIDNEGNTKTPAKVLLFDVETAPLRSYTWGLWKQNIQPDQIISDWFMLTWSAKWLFEDKVYSDGLTSREAIAQDDKRISQTIWKMINEADIIIAHNANRFDVKKLNTRFLINGLMPPMPYQVIDTLDHLRKRFSISSNRLDYVNKILGLGRKIATGGFKLWDGCVKGDKTCLKHMEEYNRSDVMILEDTYLYIRPWIKPHPNMGLFIEEDIKVCPSCSSSDLIYGGTTYNTAACIYEAFRCGNCSSVGRNKKAIKDKSTTRSIPR